MILDSSAIVAVILQEPGWEAIRARMDASTILAVSAVTLLETHIVLTNRMGIDALPILDAFTQETGAEIIPFTELHWRTAAEGFLRYGKGRHVAALNYGDCMAYATARRARLALLFKGRDFSATDVLQCHP